MFRFKNKKVTLSNHKVTLDDKHQEKMNEFEEAQRNLEKYKQEKKQYETELEKLNQISNAMCTIEQINKKFEYQENIRKLQRKITDIGSGKDKINYLKKVCSVMYDYYAELDKVALECDEEEESEYVKGGEELEEEEFNTITKEIESNPYEVSKSEETETNPETNPETKTKTKIKKQKTKKQKTKESYDSDDELADDKREVKQKNSKSLESLKQHQQQQTSVSSFGNPMLDPTVDLFAYHNNLMKTLESAIKNKTQSQTQNTIQSENFLIPSTNTHAQSGSNSNLATNSNTKFHKTFTSMSVSDSLGHTKSITRTSTSTPEGIKTTIKKSSRITDFIRNEKEMDKERKDFFSKYMRKLDATYIDDDKFQVTDDIDLCLDCNVERKWFSSDGIMICPNCSQYEAVLCEHEKPSYKDSNKDAVYFHYKRINHFNEWLAQIQGKESTDIPQEVFNSFEAEIRKYNITDKTKITHDRAKEFLKKNKHNKYYEHIPFILNKIGGRKPINIPSHIEDKLKNMFRAIQEPFHKVKPSQRKNFLNYGFVIRKMFELLHYHNNITKKNKKTYLKNLSLLSSPDKLYEQECIWRNICNELGWKYIKSDYLDTQSDEDDLY